MAHFREYTTTGVLVTPFAEDAQAASNHIERLMQAQAWTSSEYTLLGSWGTRSTSVVSNGLVTKKKIPNPPPPPPTPDPGDPPSPSIPEEIQQEWWDSKLRNMTHESDGWPWQPGFDCDDFADALAAWLQNHLVPNYPGMTVEIIWVTWYGNGHAIVRVCYNGTCYYIDPSSGLMMPVCDTPCTLQDVIDWLKEEGYIDGNPWFPGWDIKEPNERPWFEPGPWWTDPDACKKIEEETGHPCDDFIWQSFYNND